MDKPQQPDMPNTGDALIDEVRRLRREVCSQFGNDVDRLCDHLMEVQRDYAARRGPFAVVTREAAAAVAASWGEQAARREEPPESGQPAAGPSRAKPD
ncbi:MAG TPA: hypothetical protein PKY77_25240 [Phycisphaerae bacterium]|nr:hypothetical protein [Phycisphaerae bacterium]HRY71491.1 hypothetical protein [Phycisphaerae bacterium]HSA29928.1 hypothetical protein [Phycisphaerae bacterium]